MRTLPAINRRARLLAVTLAVSASFQVFPGITPRPLLAAEEKPAAAGFFERMKQWQDQMTDKFRDTWQDLWSKRDAKDVGEKAGAAVSMDLREQRDSYSVRLHLPNRDVEKVDVRFENGSLRVLAPAEGEIGRYEQSIALDGVEPQASPQVERRQKDKLIVVTIPKSAAAIAQAQPTTDKSTKGSKAFADWDDKVLARMERMREEMNRIFEESFRDFRLQPGHEGVFDEPRFGSSLDLQDEGSNYVVRAYLPDRDMKNINVQVEGRTLKIEAKAENGAREDKDEAKSAVLRKAQYAQLLTLPGPVQADRMRVDRKEGILVITLPKA